MVTLPAQEGGNWVKLNRVPAGRGRVQHGAARGKRPALARQRSSGRRSPARPLHQPRRAQLQPQPGTIAST